MTKNSGKVQFSMVDIRWLSKYISIAFLLLIPNISIADSGERWQVLPGGDSVLDLKSKHIWKRCSYGQTWVEGKGCVGDLRLISLAEAEMQNFQGWRLPAIDELSELVDNTRKSRKHTPTIDTTLFPYAAGNTHLYLSNTKSYAPNCAYLYFGSGVAIYEPCVIAAVRLVKDSL